MSFEAANHVSCSIDDRVLFYHINSDIDEDEALRLYDLGRQCFDKETVDCVLIDLKSSTEFSSAARKVWVDFLRDERIKKTAIFGGNVFVRTLASFVIAATGRENIRFFMTKEEALGWLLQPDSD